MIDILLENLEYFILFVIILVGGVGTYAVHMFEKKYKIYEEAVRKNNLIKKESENGKK